MDPYRSLSASPGLVKTQTLGHLFVGSLKDALEPSTLISRNIALVVTTVHPFGDWPTYQKGLYNRLRIRQYEHALLDIPEQTVKFNRLHLPEMHEYLQSGLNVLVHCEKGISRSVTYCLAYLIVYEGYNAHEGLELIRRNRPIANPNKGFWHQLNQLCELYSFNKPEKLRIPTPSKSNGKSRMRTRSLRRPKPIPPEVQPIASRRVRSFETEYRSSRSAEPPTVKLSKGVSIPQCEGKQAQHPKYPTEPSAFADVCRRQLMIA